MLSNFKESVFVKILELPDLTSTLRGSPLELE